MEIKICLGMFSKPERGAQWIIILGAQVRGRKITDSLKRRLDAAIHYLEENERTMVVVSGGRGPGEDISEADAMEQYLIEQGVAENRIRKEDQSVSTRENLSFSRRFIDPKHETVGIVTNNFHSYRAKLLAEQEGYAHVFSVSASSNYVFQINYLVREFFAVLAIFLKNKRIL
ncbi:YdcF family protein [[Ruminococcus] torques]|uniref:YdcF family protein n=1 Tax=[Ruminococcus] torques TaxID=33039 RepID=UPI00307A8A7C